MSISIFSKVNGVSNEGGVEVKDGFIVDNPFYKNAQDSVTALWVLKNQDMVENVIRKTMKYMGRKDYRGVDDCFNEVIQYFVERKDKEYDANYHKRRQLQELYEDEECAEILEGITLEQLETICSEGILEEETEEDEYTIERFVYSITKFITQGYVKKLYDRDKILSLDYFRDTEDSNNYSDQNSSFIDYATYNVYKKDDDFAENSTDFIYLQDILDNDLFLYDEDFRSYGLKDFKTRDFVIATLLMGFDNDKDKADFLKIAEPMYNKYYQNFRVILQGCDTGEFDDLKESLTLMVDGIRRGWIPKI